jgi:hypothetical protein
MCACFVDHSCGSAGEAIYFFNGCISKKTSFTVVAFQALVMNLERKLRFLFLQFCIVLKWVLNGGLQL